MTAGFRDILGLVVRWLSTIDAVPRSLYVAASDRQHMGVSAQDRRHLSVAASDRSHMGVTADTREG